MPEPALEVFLSRLDFYRNRVDQALDRARLAYEHIGQAGRPVALANVASLQYLAGNALDALEWAEVLAGVQTDHVLAEIGEGIKAVVEAGLDGNLIEFGAHMNRLMLSQIERGDRHYAGISALNLAHGLLHQGRGEEALAAATQAVDLLDRADRTPEFNVALAARAWAWAQVGRLDLSDEDLAAALRTDHRLTRLEVLLEAVDIHVRYGDLAKAVPLLDEALVAEATPVLRTARSLTVAETMLRMGQAEEALAELASDEEPVFGTAAQRARRLAVRARAELQCGHSRAPEVMSEAAAQARLQHARLWQGYCALAMATSGREGGVDLALSAAPEALPLLAEDVVGHLDDLDEATRGAVTTDILLRPERWRPSLRVAISSDRREALVAGRLLELVGERRDIRELRALAKRLRLKSGGSDLGRGLARTLAARVRVNDLGRSTLLIGDIEIAGTAIRRRVLSLLLFLVSRPGYSATREQVLEAIWPDLDPTDASNSLNQTTYFLRRVFEPDYDDDQSPGYLHHDSDMVWLDRGLVSSQSADCRRLLEEARSGHLADAAEQLSTAYTSPFALDFAYEDWASEFREALHAAYLEIVERAVLSHIDALEYEQALALSRRAVEVDPTAENLQLLLIRICRRLGAHSAAAEQYATYSALLKEEYGLEAPKLTDI
jgi:DNA-binding SARP family transcriptional activator